MGAIGHFVSIVTRLAGNPKSAAVDALEEIAAGYERYAYIGNRRQLQDLVVTQSEVLGDRFIALSNRDVERLSKANADLGSALVRIRNARDRVSEVATSWFGRQWEKNSGLFPDFVLAWDARPTFGNGALVELKDTDGSTIASFNSTIPTRSKSLEDVSELTGSELVSRAVMLRDAPNLVPASRPRTTFTWSACAKDPTDVRISVVERSL